MPTYIIGIRLTDKIEASDRKFAAQVEHLNQIRTAHGGSLLAAYVTFGRYDMLTVSNYPDQKSALDTIQANVAEGLFTFEVLEALSFDDFLRLKHD